MEGGSIMNKYKIKITKIYKYDKKTKFAYEIYEKQNDKSYLKVVNGSGISILNLLKIWFNITFFHKFIIRF